MPSAKSAACQKLSVALDCALNLLRSSALVRITIHEASDMAIIGPNPNDDWHRRKRQVIENWDVAISSLSRPAQTMMSRDYEALYATLGVGNFAYVTMRIVGSEYSTKATAASLGMNDRTKAECIAEWSAVKLEWVAPLPSQTDGLEEAIAQFARNFCGKWATTFCSHDSVAVVVELREALEKFMQGRSLPRQKGEVVEAFDKAIAEELPSVSHVQYDSHEICKHFASKVRERLTSNSNP